MEPRKADLLRIVTLGYLGLILALAAIPTLFDDSPPLLLAYGLFFPHVLLIPGAAVLAGWALYRKRRVEFSLAGLCVPLVMVCLMDPAWSGKKNVPQSGKVRILSVNANAWGPFDPEAQPEIAAQTMDELAERILQVDPDVLFLQELWHPWWGPGIELEERFFEKLGHLHFIKEIPADRPKGSDLELVIGSRYPLGNKAPLDASLGAEAESPYGKLRLINVHPHGPRPSPKAMSEALEHQRTWGQNIEHHLGEVKGPVILAGDLNSPPRTPIVLRLGRRLRDTFHEGGTGFGLTFPAHIPLWRIDYIFVGGSQVRVIDHQVLEWGSDHRAVMADLEIRMNGYSEGSLEGGPSIETDDH